PVRAKCSTVEMNSASPPTSAPQPIASDTIRSVPNPESDPHITSFLSSQIGTSTVTVNGSKRIDAMCRSTYNPTSPDLRDKESDNAPNTQDHLFRTTTAKGTEKNRCAA